MQRAELNELVAFDLAEAGRSEQDPWWRIAWGLRSPRDVVDERRGLEADVQALERQAQLYAPPSAEAHRRARDELVVRFFAEPGSGSGEAGPSESGVDQDDDASPRQGEAGRGEPASPVIDLQARRRRRTRVVLSALIAVAAAVVLVWVAVPRGPAGPSSAPLPGFAPEWSEQYTGTMRGSEASSGECQRYKSEGRLVVRLRPDLALADDVVVAALAQLESEPPRRLAIDPVLSAAGVITIDQPVAELGLTPGEWTVSFFVSRGETLSERELAELSPAQHPEIAVVRSRVCIEP